jgi:hypothetical protein
MTEFPFQLPEDIEEKVQTDYKELEQELIPIIRTMEKEAILDWLTAMTLQPGNERHLIRFLYVKHVALSIPEDEYKQRNVEPRLLRQIIDSTDDYEWEIIEYISFPNDEKNRFQFEGEVYNFLGTDAKIPELTLERIVTRDIPIQEKENVFPFSIKQELKKLLEMQNSLQNAIQKTSTQEIHREVHIPTEEFVNLVGPLTKLLPEFSEELWQNQKEIPPITDLNKKGSMSLNEESVSLLSILREFHIENPVIQGRIMNPNWLIECLDEKIESYLSELNQENFPDKQLQEYLERETLRSLSEVYPKESISFDCEVEGIEQNDATDLCIPFDDQIFIFCLHSMKPDNESLQEMKRNTLTLLETLENKLDYEDIKMQGELNRPPNGKFTPTVFIISQTDFDVFSWDERKVDIDVVGLDLVELRHIMQRINRQDLSTFHLAKAVKEFDQKDTLMGINPSFADFFEGSFGEDYNDLLLTAGSQMNPFLAADVQRKVIRKERPMLDLRPSYIDVPYQFRVEKFDKDIFLGYDILNEWYFFCYRSETEYHTIWETRDEPNESAALYLLAYFLAYLLKNVEREHDMSPPFDKLDIYFSIQDDSSYNSSELSKIAILNHTERENSYLVAIDSEMIHEKFEEGFSAQILPSFVLTISPWISEELLRDEISISNTIGLESAQDFDVSTIPVHSESMTFVSNLYGLPTQIDLIGVESMLREEFGDKYDSDIYAGSKARKIAKELYDFLKEELISKISEYNFRNLAIFGYDEQERLEIERKRMMVELLNDPNTPHNQLLERYVDKDGRLNTYGPAVRYLIEEAYILDAAGSREVSVIEWQEMMAMGYYILQISGILDFDNSLREIDGIDIIVRLNDGALVDLKIGEDLRREHLKNKGELVLEQPSEEVLPGLSANNGESPEDINSVREEVKKIIDSNTYTSDINDALKKTYGFDFAEYAYTVLVMFEIEGRKDTVIIKSKEELLQQITKDIELNEETVSDILEFMTMKKQESIEPWKIDSRNRLTVTPLIEHDNTIIYGPEIIQNFEQLVLNGLIEGHWVKPGKAKQPLRDALQNKRQHLENEFEEQVYIEVDQKVNQAYKNVREREGTDNNILTSTEGKIATLDESCPGEMDVVSFDATQKEVTVWEVKNIRSRYGAREMGSVIERFTGKDGHIQTLINKEEFVKRNLTSFSIDCEVNDDWEVTSRFVLPDDNPIIPYLNQAHETIPISKIDKAI